MHEVAKRETKLYDGVSIEMSDPTFSHDGGKLIFKMHGQRLRVVPFVNGRPQWGQGYTIGDAEFGGEGPTTFCKGWAIAT